MSIIFEQGRLARVGHGPHVHSLGREEANGAWGEQLLKRPSGGDAVDLGTRVQEMIVLK
ncbi:hypothetical protein L226DRAFT_567339 [Lentinus tigrinus ALCF2SS1-7]|uniref:Uncharacterized protein n=1 Tax=Lentinus tigrinus ALCF2SS1-6 TaxID=1328759 RepID=A0A5C2SNP0_9APHY|nr:hypothetical protein L227DRAFT_606933 [Lentinus tigrinus ALCF2SS1-6]RPD79168.1 hypothetical protein L226DRAFT_567339 [Lentinus tigrinus ALCF2SS1-7]